MALVIFRGVTRNRFPLHHRAIAIQKFYSTKPSEKPSVNDKPFDEKQSQNAPPKNEENDPSKSRAQHKITEVKSKISESQRNAEKVREDIRGYALNRFVNYVQNYDKVLEKKFPGAMKVYRVFIDGVKSFYRDMIDLMKIRASLTLEAKSLSSLSRRELEIHYLMPRDMLKVAPILLVSALPFAHYVTMPIAYMYPRRLLTRHFWTLQQRSEFAVLNLRDRLAYNRSVFRFLQSKLPQIKNDRNYEQWRDILGKVGSGLHPTAEEIISVKDLFSEIPYKTTSLSYTHIKYLCGLHGINSMFFKKSKLTYHAMCVHFMDMAIEREGGTQSLPTDVLRDACFLRGLNASNMSNEELVKWLDQWIHVSKCINKTNFSLFLHLPILTTYNHPNNWRLIYRER